MRRLLIVLAMFGLASAQGGSWEKVALRTDPGALIHATLRSTVGVVLDEIPASMRSRVVESLIAKPADFWTERAHRQLQLTAYRLVFRRFFYARQVDALPLPPESLWNIALVGAPARRTVDGHDVVAVDYSFSSVLVTDTESPAVSEPHLTHIGGEWREPFVLPLDPELVLQRTGYACMDEEAFPFASVDSEEVDSFYDQTCGVEDGLSNTGQCHFTRSAAQSCVEAVRDHIGKINTGVRFTRVPWDPAVAAAYRYGRVSGEEPDLQIYLPDFLPSRTTYRYIHTIQTAGCEVAEGSVGGTGWRRLLQFSTSDENVGKRDLTIGGVDYTISGHPEELDEHHLYEFSPCHRHYHFKYYGQLTWAGPGIILNSKKGFCLQSTARVANRETSPLNNTFVSCNYQGVAPGWVDQYKAGLSNQWLDTTDLASGPGTRTFRSNPNGLLCEGTFVDQDGNAIPEGDPVVWAPTGLTTDDGKPVEAPLCRQGPHWDTNNEHSSSETIEPQGRGLITSPCERGQIGPLRNCGFDPHPTTASCTPGASTTVVFRIGAAAEPQVVRLTEFSHALNSPIPAKYEDSYVPLLPGVSDQPAMLANEIVTASKPISVTFTCPSERNGGVYEPGGQYSIYTAPVYPDDASSPITRSARLADPH